MSGYLWFNQTGSPVVDEILQAIQSAGDAYHHTKSWRDTDFLEKSCVESIEEAANKAAERIADLERQLAEAKAYNKELLTVMMAAAVEIKEHWDAHCDTDGYGPANLIRRLETGVTGGGYGYTAETVVDMQAEIEAMRPVVDAAVLYGKYNDIDSGRDLMDAVSDYESRKQP